MRGGGAVFLAVAEEPPRFLCDHDDALYTVRTYVLYHAGCMVRPCCGAGPRSLARCLTAKKKKQYLVGAGGPGIIVSNNKQ